MIGVSPQIWARLGQIARGIAPLGIIFGPAAAQAEARQPAAIELVLALRDPEVLQAVENLRPLAS